MQFIQTILAFLACFCLLAIPVTAGNADKIKRGALIPYYIDYTDVTLDPLQTSDGNEIFAQGVFGGYLESFIYTREIYNEADPASSTRENIGSATYNIVLDYFDGSATGTDICWAGTYTSIARFDHGTTGRVEAHFSGTIKYQCPLDSPDNAGTDSFVEYVAGGTLPQAQSPILSGGGVVNLYEDSRGNKRSQKWNNVQVWDRRAEFQGNCDFTNFPPTGGCVTEYALDFRRPAKLSKRAPAGYPEEAV
jgi:hypothetical protein